MSNHRAAAAVIANAVTNILVHEDSMHRFHSITIERPGWIRTYHASSWSYCRLMNVLQWHEDNHTWNVIAKPQSRTWQLQAWPVER